jgi:hypothetical protein
MTHRFIIAVDEESPATVKKMISLLNATGPVGWWHYTKGTWLVLERTGTLTADKLRAKIMAEFPEVTHLVLEIPSGGTWSGFGPTKMKKWLVEQWDRED